jgi:hypothetical protein
LLDGFDDLFCRARKPVEFPDDERVAAAGGVARKSLDASGQP